MKYIELALRRNKISQRRRQRPSHSWGHDAHGGVRGVQVAGRNIGNILFFQDCGIKYLLRRNKSYVAVRSHLGGNRWIPESQRYCRLALFEHPQARSNIPRKTSDIDVFFPWDFRIIISMSETWGRMCTVRVIYDSDDLLYLSQLFERFLGTNNNNSLL